MLKELLYDFTLFSLIEGIIYVLFFERIFNVNKFSLMEYVFLSLGNCILSVIYPPLFYQFMMIVWMAIFISIKQGRIILKYFQYPITIVAIMLIVEATYDVSINLLFGFSLASVENKLLLFLYLISIKFLEFVMIIKGGDFMKTWFGKIKK